MHILFVYLVQMFYTLKNGGGSIYCLIKNYVMRPAPHMKHLCHYSSFNITLYHIRKFIHNHRFRKRYIRILKNTFTDRFINHTIELYNVEKTHSLIYFGYYSCIIYETELIYQVISSLPEKEQKIIILFLNGYTFDDIAHISELPDHIIQLKLYSIHKKLKNNYCLQKSEQVK